MRVLGMLVVGALYGVLLRGWMRFVSTDPEFSWSGSGYIVGIFSILGLMVGLVGLARRRAWVLGTVGLRMVGSVLALGCFMAAGVAMFPTIVPAALGVARSDWRGWIRAGLIGLGALVAVMVIVDLDELSVGHRLVALVLYLGLCAVEVALLSRILAPSLPAGSVAHASRPVRFLLVGAPLLAVFALVIATVGIPT